MTLQAKGFQWSMAIHGMLILVVAVLQFFAVSQNKVTIIDFTLSDNNESSVIEQNPPYQAPAMKQEPAVKQEPKHTKAIRPQEIVEEHNAQNPEVEKAQSPSEVSSNGEAIPTSLPQAADDPGAPSAEGQGIPTSLPHAADGLGAPSVKGASRDVADSAGSAQGTVGSSGNAGAGSTPEKSRVSYLKEHFVYIRDRITGSISYPHMARKMGWCGQVKIAFVICEDGGVNDVRVVESSGFSLLDRNAVNTVKDVAPFPSPPVKAEIRMGITYRLK